MKSRSTKALQKNAPALPNVKPLRWTKELLALPALSVRQPFAWLITQGIKDVENRSTRLVSLPKRVLIHASLSKAMLNDIYQDEWDEWQTLANNRMPLDYDIGGIVGAATITACVRDHSSPWKDPSSWAWVLSDAKPLPFRECKGAVGFFYPKLSERP